MAIASNAEVVALARQALRDTSENHKPVEIGSWILQRLLSRLEAAKAEHNDAIKRLHYALEECERLREFPGKIQLEAENARLRPIVERMADEDCESYCGEHPSSEHECWPAIARAALEEKKQEREEK